MADRHSNDGSVRMSQEYADRIAPIVDLPEPPAWYGEASCPETDPEAFFPEKGGSTRPAKSTCSSCPVQQKCLQYAVDNDEQHGVWGGLSPKERRRLKRVAA